MKYYIKIIRTTYDGTIAEKVSLVNVSEAMALKCLDIYGKPGYDVKIRGYNEMEEGEADAD